MRLSSVVFMGAVMLAQVSTLGALPVPSGAQSVESSLAAAVSHSGAATVTVTVTSTVGFSTSTSHVRSTSSSASAVHTSSPSAVHTSPASTHSAHPTTPSAAKPTSSTARALPTSSTHHPAPPASSAVPSADLATAGGAVAHPDSAASSTTVSSAASRTTLTVPASSHPSSSASASASSGASAASTSARSSTVGNSGSSPSAQADGPTLPSGTFFNGAASRGPGMVAATAAAVVALLRRVPRRAVERAAGRARPGLPMAQSSFVLRAPLNILDAPIAPTFIFLLASVFSVAGSGAASPLTNAARLVRKLSVQQASGSSRQLQVPPAHEHVNVPAMLSPTAGTFVVGTNGTSATTHVWLHDTPFLACMSEILLPGKLRHLRPGLAPRGLVPTKLVNAEIKTVGMRVFAALVLAFMVLLQAHWAASASVPILRVGVPKLPLTAREAAVLAQPDEVTPVYPRAAAPQRRTVQPRLPPPPSHHESHPEDFRMEEPAASAQVSVLAVGVIALVVVFHACDFL
ncbi:uncharacterized protein BXZ73DRAFT_75635 [Epithele typhae]|uniref:uncharacterized protein n=1 Tax=Epithele typhae TaxID=378194 RepID=UPI002007A6E3|nr:uncharacterized protein BXZ73DRAFT_75635 [Epithele typhae]KAH9940004.1 hypothetical protein BXZ73DRAFT_75635 [Epithele typhae]